MSQEAISAPCSSIFDGSISSRRALTPKVIDEMVIVYYISIIYHISYPSCVSMSQSTRVNLRVVSTELCIKLSNFMFKVLKKSQKIYCCAEST